MSTRHWAYTVCVNYTQSLAIHQTTTATDFNVSLNRAEYTKYLVNIRRKSWALRNGSRRSSGSAFQVIVPQ